MWIIYYLKKQVDTQLPAAWVLDKYYVTLVTLDSVKLWPACMGLDVCVC